MKNISLKIKIGTGLLLTCLIVPISQPAISQPAGANPKIDIAQSHSRELIREVLSRYRTTAKSSENFAELPRHVIYQALFSKILRQEFFGNQFSANDIQTIRSLRSPNDARFKEPDNERLLKICDQVTSGKADYQKVAAEFDASKRAYHEQLKQHYEGVLSTLSARARTLVAQMEIDLSTTDQITYSEMNTLGVYDEAPDLVINLFNRFCSAFPIAIANDPPKNEYLLEVPDNTTFLEFGE